MIYFIQDSRRLLIKIGYTGKESVKDRLRAAKTWVTSRLAVLHLIEFGTEAEEKKLQKRVGASRYVGEWFRPTEEVIALLMEFARQEGYQQGRAEGRMELHDEVYDELEQEAAELVASEKRFLYHTTLCYPAAASEHGTDFDVHITSPTAVGYLRAIGKDIKEQGN